MNLWLIGIIVFLGLGALVSVLYRVSSSFRRHLKIDMRKERKVRIGFDVGLMYAIGKVVWKWQNAPVGSLKRMGWIVFVSLVVAYLIWMIMRMIDRRINGPDTSNKSRLGEWIEQES